MQIPLSSIWIAPDRQRKQIDTSNLVESISARGVIVPIIVTKEPGPNGEAYLLIAGERRYTASKQLSLPDIPARLLSDLSESECKIIELEENLRRSNLTWQEQVRAINSIHELLLANDEKWNVAKTAKHLSYNASFIGNICFVAKNLDREKIANAETMTNALNILTREKERLGADAVADILSTPLSTKVAPPPPISESDLEEATPSVAAIPSIVKAEESILQQSFLDWAPNYSDQPFNFIHCDFPYGVEVFGGKWSGKQSWSEYKDTPDIYFALIECLCQNLDRVMAHSGHLMFWLSADITIQSKTLAMFASLAPTLAFSTFPLVWLKSDNVGIVPDPTREPRRITETALIASREDRLLIKPVSNAIAAPTHKEHHPHTKPESVLKHFFQMFVDNHTRMLDPTCGGGSSLRAAEALGACHVTGLEINPEYVENSRRALNASRVTRRASELAKKG